MSELEHSPYMVVDERFETWKGKRLSKRKKTTMLAISMQRTLADIQYALRKHRGIMKDAAEYLGTTREVLQRKIDMTPSLQVLLRNIEQENIDLAERKLLEQVDD